MTRLLSVLAGILANRTGRRDRPRMLTYAVTFTCNARCVFCDSWKKPSRDALTLAEIERIFTDLPRMDVVRLTGGEPFVRPDLPDIVRLAERKLRPAVLHVTTNGFLTDRIVKFAERRDHRRPLHLLVSIDGLKEVHDRTRGSDAAFDRAIATLEALAPRRKELGLRIAVNQTVADREGAEHYRRLREYLRPLGVKNQLVLAYARSATYSTDRETVVAPESEGDFEAFGRIPAGELSALLDEAMEDTRDLPFAARIAKRYYLRGIRNRLLGGRGTPNPSCVALASHLRILPNGDVPTCQFNSVTVGNLRRQTFDAVWPSAAAREQRAWVKACPGCWAECEVVPSGLFTGDLLTPRLRPGWRQGGEKIDHLPETLSAS
jgi:MoaA/NifB/PqqE/SkfB family radical SAM enzyme